ncbi:class I SAM-dependent methyltransferase [Maribellus mangrovi]|uniref:class I SAM-dependent methyltransferase n=1 Tax=Maribellus mangrovi TaxID=3133146 RepID=UPI0030EE6F9D
MLNYGNDNKKAVKAKLDAQKIAFAPMMFQAAKTLRDLGILNYLLKNKKGADLQTVANAIGISVYGAKVLLEAGLSMELVYVENDIYKLTKTGYFIESDELTRVNMDFTHDVNYRGSFYLSDSIKEGRPAGLEVFGNWQSIYEGLSELPEDVKKSWFDFDHYYSDVAFTEVMEILFRNDTNKILDIGGNTGKFAIKCANYNSNNQITIMDLPGQIAVAEKNIAKAGLSDRIKTLKADLLNLSVSFPKAYNIIWMSQFLDCFSKDEILSLLQRAHDALDETGSLYILETYWDRQKYKASTYSLHAISLYFTNMANGNSQMYHSSDMTKLIEKANLKVVNEYDNIGVSHTLFEIKKK